MNSLLNMLVIYINACIRECKISLETEEKSKEIAFLQGKITGYRTLLVYLQEAFSLTASFIEDTGDVPVEIESLTYTEIDNLSMGVDALLASDEWQIVNDEIKLRKEELKSFLLYEAENARDLYVSQAQCLAVTCAGGLFKRIKDEGRSRDEELPFGDEELTVGAEDGTPA
jgi:hypothetical protein